ncbi:type III polyketide synthase [bacterium]|nr:MAG: type III polyketide synthase [bacterium]
MILHENGPKIYLATVATATPPYSVDQREAGRFFHQHYSGRLTKRYLGIMDGIMAHPAINRRHFALDDPRCLLDEDPDSRIDRFTDWAVKLSQQAALKALAQVELSVDDISSLIVNTCTGYICPGITSYLIEDMGLARDVRAHDLVGSGCGGAVPNLQMGFDHLKANGDGIALCISVEICSATYQMGNDLSLILSNTLFGDGASASILWGRRKGLEMITSASRHDPERRDTIRYIYKNGQLHNQLSTSLPRIVNRAVGEAVKEALETTGLKTKDISHWAFHGGGDSVINSIQEELGLDDRHMQPTRNVLSDYGNMSSPSAMFVLRQILDNGVNEGDLCMLVAFGAGLSAHAYLMRAV